MSKVYEDYVYWIWLTKITGIGPVLQRRLLQRYGTPKEIYGLLKYNTINSEDSFIRKIDKENINQAFEKAQRIYDDCVKQGISCITLNSSFYPVMARNLSDMPILLYNKGNPQKDWWGDAIVGARRCTKDGKNKTLELAKTLGNNGITVISGMAKGIDSYAHTECILNNSYTVAVLGSGLDICYPIEHTELMRHIIDKGLIISEYEPGMKPTKYTFPRRNRIIAACARRIYIPDVGDRSGAKITASYGMKYGREVIWGENL